ncbi:MAG: phosphatidylserine decarboxylase family protein [Flavobacteriaceae bacterium]
MFHKEGHKIILISFILTVILFLLIDNFIIETAWLRTVLMLLILVFLILILQFFRNPKRQTKINDHHIISPVDGKVVVIEEVYEKEYLKQQCIQLSVFMSPINVHVTRYPISGDITFSKYHEGKYLVAWHPKASEENERTTVVVKSKIFGEVLFRQIAGALAKRIVNYAKEGGNAKQGEDSGFIKFGSRVDIYIPLDSRIKVKLNDKVRGGESVLASYD